MFQININNINVKCIRQRVQKPCSNVTYTWNIKGDKIGFRQAIIFSLKNFVILSK